MREPESYGKVPYTSVKEALKQIEEHYATCPERLQDVEITFEYLVGSFFPRILDNINAAFNKQYTLGYIQGRQDAISQESLKAVEQLLKEEDNEDQGNN